MTFTGRAGPYGIEVPPEIYDDIKARLKAAGCWIDECLDDGEQLLDLHVPLRRERSGGLTIGSRSFERLSQKTPGT